MEGVLLGFGIVLVIIGVGLLSAALLPRDTAVQMQRGLTPAIYYVTNPLLMVVLLAEADLAVLVGTFVPVALVVAGVGAAAYAVVSWLVLHRPLAQTAVGSMASTYLNAGNIGLPIAIYAVGTPAPAVAVLMAQLLVVAPLYLTLFGWCSRQAGSAQPRLWRTIIRSVANPVTVGAVVGVAMALIDWTPPEILWTPVDMLGHASIPLLLLLFGMSLYGQRPLQDRALVPDIVWGSVVKLAVMPAAAWAIGRFVFGLSGAELFGVVAMAALPTAQNVYLFSSQFKLPNLLVRDIVFTSAVLSLPVILVVAVLLGP
ncbi:AEC family transporter [Citricoccus sp. GCM10030269]|uniref:AEC family transporter n=1 Tax=Citricoccus sp. GCM10030269 TaxID=3273388 RepID=UPI00360BE4CC